MSAITWTHLTNAAVTGTVLSKSGGFNATPDAGATSTQSFSADGNASVAAPSTLDDLVFGLATSSALQLDWTNVPFAFNLSPTGSGGSWEVREAGVYKADGLYNANDVFTIARVGTAITYKINGTTVYTSGATSSGTLYVQVQLRGSSSAVSNGDMTVSGGGGGGGSIVPTLVATTPTTQTAAPTTYPNVLSSRTAFAMPTLANMPVVPSAVNVAFNDPFFNRPLRRVTNATTNASGKGWRTSSSEQVTIWGRGSDRGHFLRPDGTVEYWTLNAATKALTWVRSLTNFNAEPTWARVAGKEHLLYGTTAGMLIKQYNSNANTYSTLLDLSTVDAAFTGGSFAWGGSIQSSASSPERLACFYGGTSQDTHFRVLVFDVDHPTDATKQLILDTLASTINGVAVPMGGHTFHLHAIGIDQSGRYVILYPTQPDINAGTAAKLFWDLQTGTITPVTIPMFNQGHDTLGYGTWVNQDGDISGSAGTTYDAWQWAQRQLSDLTHPAAVINPTLTPALVNGADDHPSYGNARSDAIVPFVTATDRVYDTSVVPWRAWDGQILLVHPLTGVVYRCCYTYADSSGNFWYQPIAFISPDGRWILYDSNMMKTLGLEPGDPSTFRTDIFLIDTTDVIGTTPVTPPVVPPSPTTATTITAIAQRQTPVAFTASKGSKVDLTVYKGSRKDVTFTLSPPISGGIAGFNILATIRTMSDVVVQTIAATITDGANSVFTLSFLQSLNLPPGQYFWDVWRVDIGNEEIYLSPGILTVARSARTVA